MKEVINDKMELVGFVLRLEQFGYPFMVTVEAYDNIRTAEQNKMLWGTLTDISKQVVWHGLRLSPEDWKDMLTAALTSIRVVPNIDGTGFVTLGVSTRRMNKKVFSELIELAIAFGDEQGVKWSNPADILNYIKEQENKTEGDG